MGSESSRQATSPWQAATRPPRSNATHESSTDPRGPAVQDGRIPRSPAALHHPYPVREPIRSDRRCRDDPGDRERRSGSRHRDDRAERARRRNGGGRSPPDQADIRLGGTDKGNFRGVFHPPDSGWFGRRFSRLQAGRAARHDRLNSVAGHQCTGNATFLNSSSHSCWSRMCIARSTTSRVRCGANIWIKS